MMANSPSFPQLRRLFASLKRRDSVTIDEQATPPTIEAGSSIMNQQVSRRAALAATTAIAAVSVVPSNAMASETPDERVMRLANELSEAMNGFMTRPGETPHWVAHVQPSTYANPVSFSQNAKSIWEPDEELTAMAREFKLAEATWKTLWEECERTIDDFESRNGDPQDHCPINAFPEYWQKRHAECEPSIEASADMAEVCDGIRKRLHAIPAKTIAGIAAKAETLQFDTGLYPKDPERPINEWDWDVECLHLFIEDARRLAKGPAGSGKSTSAGSERHRTPPATLEMLIAAHVAALAEYDAVPDSEFNGPRCQALGRIVDVSRQALLDYRPAFLAEAARKAAFMASCRTFVEWDDLDRAVLIKAFQI